MAKRKSQALPMAMPAAGRVAAKKRRRRKPPEDTETLNEIIGDLKERIAQMAAMIDRLTESKSKEGLLVKVFAQHAESASRLGRLLRDRRALSGAAADGFAGAVAQALDEVSTLLERDDL